MPQKFVFRKAGKTTVSRSSLPMRLKSGLKKADVLIQTPLRNVRAPGRRYFLVHHYSKKEGFGLLRLRNPRSNEILATLRYVPSGKNLEVWDVATPKQWQNRGLSRFLFEQLEGIARKRDFAKIQLYTDNIEPLPFYQRLGFKIIGSQRMIHAYLRGKKEILKGKKLYFILLKDMCPKSTD